MKPDEIVRALRCMHAFEGTPSDMTCGNCEYYESYSGTIVDDEDDGCPGRCNGKFCEEAADLIESLQAQLTEAQRERGKVMEDMKYYLENNEENGVVYIPRFVVERIIKRRGPQGVEG